MEMIDVYNDSPRSRLEGFLFELIKKHDRKVIPLTYIEASGTQYIDTGIYDIQNKEFTIDFQVVPTSFNMTLLGGITDKEKKIIIFLNKYQYSSDAGFGISTSKWKPDTDRHTAFIGIKEKQIRLNIDAGDESNYPFSTCTEAITSLYLFALNANTPPTHSIHGVVEYTTGRVYSLTVTQNGETIIEMKPYLVDGVPCMIDEISGQEFYNLGTGQFGYDGVEPT